MNIAVKFGGFYGGNHEQKIESMISMYEDEGDEFNNYKDLITMYSREYLDFLNLELGVNLMFVSIDSPKFYNFRTDEIIAKIEDDQVELSKGYIDMYIRNNELNKELEEYIDNITKSSSGYIPFYTKEDVYKPENVDILLQCMIKVVCRSTEDEWDSYYDINSLYEMVYRF